MLIRWFFAAVFLIILAKAADPASAKDMTDMAASSTGPLVAFTVDDLPFASGSAMPLTKDDAATARGVNRQLLQAFARHKIPATGFVNEQRIEQIGQPTGLAILAAWIKPGFDLGNHLYSHPDVNMLTIESAEMEIIRGEASIAAVMARGSRRPEYLRFPFSHTGETKEKHDAIAAFMAARGYRLAPCTIDNSDYDFARAYRLALDRGDRATLAKIRATYLAFTGSALDWYTGLNSRVLGYEPPHIMLLHDSVLNADTIEATIALFTQRGYRFISLGQALSDPAYATPETITKYGPMWGYRWARERHVAIDGSAEPEPPGWIYDYIKNNGEGGPGIVEHSIR